MKANVLSKILVLILSILMLSSNLYAFPNVSQDYNLEGDYSSVFNVIHEANSHINNNKSIMEIIKDTDANIYLPFLIFMQQYNISPNSDKLIACWIVYSSNPSIGLPSKYCADGEKRGLKFLDLLDYMMLRYLVENP